MKYKKQLIIILTLLIALTSTITIVNAGRYTGWSWWHRHKRITTSTPSVKPTGTVKPSSDAKPTGTVKPSSDVKPTATVKPTSDVKPTSTAKPTDNTVPTATSNNEANKKQIDIILVNSTGSANILWLGTSKEILTTNEIKSGDVRYDKLSLSVVSNNLNDSITANCAQGTTIVSTKTLTVTGTYAEGKPVVVMWDGTNFSASY